MITHAYAELEVSAKAYDEIAGKLREAGYDHAFNEGAIDMHGIALVKAAPVEKTDDTKWREHAMESVRLAALRYPDFTIDDITYNKHPTDPRAMGRVLREAAYKGICRRTDRFAPSRRSNGHVGPRAVWESLILSPHIENRVHQA